MKKLYDLAELSVQNDLESNVVGLFKDAIKEKRRTQQLLDEINSAIREAMGTGDYEDAVRILRRCGRM